MKNSSIIIKALSVLVSGTIIITFIIPKFDDIKAVQNSISAYEAQLANVTRINAQLQSRIDEINAISPADQSALLAFLPDHIDSISVVRTVQNIAATANLQPSQIGYAGAAQTDDSNIVTHTFNFSAVGSYSDVTDFFSLLEQNNYLLEFREVQLSADEDGGVVIDGSLASYSLLNLDTSSEG